MQVDSNRIIQEVLLRLPKLENGDAILLQPYKKDRSVYVVRGKSSYQIIERGFIRKEYSVEAQKIRRTLKRVCKKEFPRSKKIWLYFRTAEDVEGLLE